MIARKAKSFPLTLLEVHTLVHVLCALFMYFFWFQKPVGVRDPTMVDEPTSEKLQEAILDHAHDPSRPMNLITSRASNITSINYTFGPWESATVFGIVCLVTAAYGGVHLAAWRFDFPTHTECWIWKIICIITVAGSLFAPAWLVFASRCFDGSGGGAKKMREMLLRYLTCRKSAWEGIPPCMIAMVYPYWLISVMMAPLFIFSRVGIVVESFLSLRKVPEGAYATVGWSEYIPHI
jgi:hypothetical protein